MLAVSGFRVDACDFGRLAGQQLDPVVVGYGAMRVSPSGTARASQARIRGFESRHPLQSETERSPATEAALFWWTCLVDFGKGYTVPTSPSEGIKAQLKGYLVLGSMWLIWIGKLVPYHLATPA